MITGIVGSLKPEVRELFEEKVTADNLRKHCFATAAVMYRLAERFGEDRVRWAAAGLLHDLDFEETKDSPELHGLKAAELLGLAGVDEDIIQAIKAHNAEALGLTRKTRLDFAVTCAEALTGLVVATALVQPDKKLAGVKPNSVRKRMKERAFARNVNRDAILLCECLGLSVDEFLALGVSAMQEISEMLQL